MKPARRAVPPAILEVLCVAASAALLVAGQAPVEARCAPWLALVPAFWVLSRVSRTRASLLGGLHGTLYAALTTWWLFPTVSDYFGQGPTFSGVFLAGFWLATVGVYVAVLFAAMAHVRIELSRSAWIAFAPAAWVATELLRSHVGLRSPWAKLGDALFGLDHLRQLASLGGVYSLSALAVLANLALFELGGLRKRRLRALAPSALFLPLVAGAWLYGEARLTDLRKSMARADSITLAAIQANVPSELTWRRSSLMQVFGAHAALSRAALREGPLDLVIWPEQALQTSPDDAQLALDLNLLLEELSTPLLIGAVRSEERPGSGGVAFNSAFLLAAGGSTRLHYDKIRLLPFSETQPLGSILEFGEDRDLADLRYAAGTEPGLLRWSGPTLGVSICFEGTYPATTRELARRGARLLVNLANDSWFRGTGGAAQHLAQVRFRAVETGLPLVRAASSGISAVVLPDGEVTGILDAGRAGVLLAPVPVVDPVPTFYTRTGDAFAWLSAAGALLAVVLPLRRLGLSRPDRALAPLGPDHGVVTKP